jgi:hypothetical protein
VPGPPAAFWSQSSEDRGPGPVMDWQGYRIFRKGEHA